MKDYQLIPYCAMTNCVECDHTLECKMFYENHGRLPYLFYKPYVKTDIEHLLEKLEVEVPEVPIEMNVKIKKSGIKNRWKGKKL